MLPISLLLQQDAGKHFLTFVEAAFDQPLKQQLIIVIFLVVVVGSVLAFVLHVQNSDNS